ncbi:MAG: dethiobiotin synthase [Deltaproteobacteria bacterium]|nr:dethiobiotin synthase [Deltaproteobacteria bacterium]
MKGVFVTGTDTGVGKTVVCGLLARYLRAQGIRAVTQKWVQTGTGGEPTDLQVHRRLMGIPGDVPEAELHDLCPYRFPFPASPHLSAAREGAVVDAEVIGAAYRRLAAAHDAVLVEGAGGVLVPLSLRLLTVDLVARLGMSAVVVVGNRLGCVNHALLAVEAIRLRGIRPVALVFNRPEASVAAPDEVLSDNLRAVEEIGKVPVLGELPFLPDPVAGAEAFAPVGRAFLSLWREG